jgi:hypothetical protein
MKTTQKQKFFKFFLKHSLKYIILNKKIEDIGLVGFKEKK